jgi:SAM-dependent methyltransferase
VPPPTIPPDPGVLAGLRTLLLEQADAIDDAMGPSPGVSPRIDRDLYKRRLVGESSRPATLAKLFRLGSPAAAGDATSALAPVALDTLLQTGLAELDDDVVRPLARISAYGGTLIASDLQRSPDPPDFVPGPNPAASRVERLTIRRPVRSALDVGAGSGLQALLAAAHSERVVAVEINERALDYNRFSAVLNGVSNMDIRHGSWFEPVAGERFDLIVANPPYVVSPGSDVLYRDSGLPGDAVSRKLLEEAPAFLEEGGFAHLMGNWAHGKDKAWRTPIEQVIEGSGCDALLLKYSTLDPVAYAAQWNSLAAQGSEVLLAAVDRWLDYYRAEQIEAISEVMVVLRRRSGPGNWVRAIEVPTSPTRSAGDHVLRLFEARDRRDDLAEEAAVLASPFAMAPGAKLSWSAEGPQLAETKAKVGLEGGVGFAAPVSPEVAAWLQGLGGSGCLDELASDEAVSAVRRLFALGLLVRP